MILEQTPLDGGDRGQGILVRQRIFGRPNQRHDPGDSTLQDSREGACSWSVFHSSECFSTNQSLATGSPSGLWVAGTAVKLRQEHGRSTGFGQATSRLSMFNHSSNIAPSIIDTRGVARSNLSRSIHEAKSRHQRLPQSNDREPSQ